MLIDTQPTIPLRLDDAAKLEALRIAVLSRVIARTGYLCADLNFVYRVCTLHACTLQLDLHSTGRR